MIALNNHQMDRERGGRGSKMSTEGWESGRGEMIGHFMKMEEKVGEGENNRMCEHTHTHRERERERESISCQFIYYARRL